MLPNGDRKFILVGNSCRDLYGVEPEEIYENPDLIYSKIHHEDISGLIAKEEEALGNMETFSSEARIENPDGTYRWSLIVSSPTKQLDGSTLWNGVESVITEKKKSEDQQKLMKEQFANQQRLESIGVLAAGVAHEINNPLNGVMNYAQLILESGNEKIDESTYADEILHETDRISKIVKNLLQFSRQESKEFHKEKVEVILNSTLSLVRTILKKDQIELKVKINKKLPMLECRSNQIQQIILNLITNSQHALNQKYSGFNQQKIIKIIAEKKRRLKVSWIRITIEDKGNGIPVDIQNNIFEPFFSTKGRIEGTGLGLSISHGIVKEHNGEISFETEEGKFTRFHIDLPCKQMI